MKILALLAYFPLFGWFFPMFLAPKNQFCQYHAKQGLASCLFFVISISLAWLVGHTIPGFLRYVEWSLYLAVILSYLVLLVLGVLAVIRKVQKPLPYIGKKAENIPV